MKKKALFFAGLCVLGLCTMEAQAMNLPITGADLPIIMSNMPNIFEQIILQGDLATNAGPNAIEAGASDDAVYIGFNQSFGNVNISIFNGMGALVYNTVVNTDVQQIIIIPFDSAASGSYTVELSNATGYAEGDFDKD